MNELARLSTKLARGMKKTFYWQTNNSPFLSGDVFSDNADASVLANTFRKPPVTSRQISNARVIFCPSNRIVEFLEVYSKAITARVLIFGNSDEDFHDFKYKLPKSVKRVYLQNMSFQDERFRCLPIGIENSRLGTNGLKRNFREYSKFETKSNVLLVGPFSRTHNERDEILDNLIPSINTEILRHRIQPSEYGDVSGKFKFIAAPRGNGVDTHRFWEALYRNSIPVVKKNEWSKSLDYLKIPYLTVDEWTMADIENLISQQRKIQYTPRSTEAIWWKYWKYLIDKDC